MAKHRGEPPSATPYIVAAALLGIVAIITIYGYLR